MRFTWRNPLRRRTGSTAARDRHDAGGRDDARFDDAYQARRRAILRTDAAKANRLDRIKRAGKQLARVDR